MKKYKKSKLLLALVSIVILILIGISLLSNTSESKNSVFPPAENQEIVLKPGKVIYLKDATTLYSLGAVGSEFYFTEDKLVVKKGDEVNTFKISYDKTNISIEELEKQLQIGQDLPDISSYKNISRYDLCKSTKDLPGYRLYTLDNNIYWMSTLYNNDIWRIISMEASYWNYGE